MKMFTYNLAKSRNRRPRFLFRSHKFRFHEQFIIDFPHCCNFIYQLKCFFRSRPETLNDSRIRMVNSWIHELVVEARDIWGMRVPAQLDPNNFYPTPVPSEGRSDDDDSSSSSTVSSHSTESGECRPSTSASTTASGLGRTETAEAEATSSSTCGYPSSTPFDYPTSTSQEFNVDDWIRNIIRSLRFLSNSANRTERSAGLSQLSWEAFVNRCTWRIMESYFSAVVESEDYKHWYHIPKPNQDSDDETPPGN